MLVWVVLMKDVRFTSEGDILDKTVSPVAAYKGFSEALEHAEKGNGKLIKANAARIELPNGEILWTNYYVHKSPVYLK